MLAVVRRPGASPSGVTFSVPVKPAVTVTAAEPVVPVPDASAGADTATGRRATGSRTEVAPLRRVTKPFAHWWRGALVRVKAMSSAWVWPALLKGRFDRVVAVKPGT